jgi:putative CocE/NonD family hydrolase
MDMLIERNAKVRMRDGVELATDVYRPAVADPTPAILQRTPYNKDMAPSPEILRLAGAGYAVVVQDTRGRYQSGGQFSPFVDEASDGEEAVAWCAAQPWCVGRVGMMGSSYVGATQWLAAARAPSALCAIAPAITAADYHEGWTYQGGALALGFVLTWTMMFLGLGDVARRLGRGEADMDELMSLVRTVDDIGNQFGQRPLSDPPFRHDLAPYYRHWLGHPGNDDGWRALAPKERYGAVIVPSLNIGGWYDLFLAGTLANYRGMKEAGGSPSARRPHLLVGPWAHANVTGEFPERRYGMLGGALLADLTGRQLKWFDHHLKGLDNGLESQKPVRLFIMGQDVWRDEDDWPPPGAVFTKFYLHSAGRARSAQGDGALTLAAPAEEPSDTYVYDPRAPVPTVGGATFLPGLVISANAGPRDQRAVEAREDVLCFTSEVLERPLEVTGPIELVLYVSSSAVDTDFTGKLVDVHPDGRAEILTDGILRARYRNSLSDPELLEPGRVYEISIDLQATANEFAPGHRIRLEVSSSNFPRFDVNTNTGGVISDEAAADAVQAMNTVYHDGLHPSHLTLPLVSRG